MRPNINTPCFYYTCLNVKFQEQTISLYGYRKDFHAGFLF